MSVVVEYGVCECSSGVWNNDYSCSLCVLLFAVVPTVVSSTIREHHALGRLGRDGKGDHVILL